MLVTELSPTQTSLAQSANAICISLGLHLFTVLKTDLGDHQPLYLCAGKVTKSLCISTQSTFIQTQHAIHTVKVKVLQVHGVRNMNCPREDSVETELWEKVRQKEAKDTEAMTRRHKVKLLKTTCKFHLQVK